MVRTAESVRLAEYTTLGLGGPAGRFIAAATEDELVAAVRAADQAGEPLLVLGGGSNLVVADKGFPGTVVQVATRGVAAEVTGGSARVTVAAGEAWDAVVAWSVADALSGIECLSGIPGLTGATPIQNVSAYGQEVAQTIMSVRVYDRRRDEVLELPAADCGFGYRTSTFKREMWPGPAAAQAASGAVCGRYVVLTVTFRLGADTLSAPIRYRELARALSVAEGERVPLAAAREAVLRLRRSKGMVVDPTDPDTRSAGSFFTNPVVSEAEFAVLAARAGQVGAKADGASETGQVPHWPEGGGRVKISAAWLIEHAGYTKGFRLCDDPGAPRISTKHALALTNPAEGSTESLVRLAQEIRDGVLGTFGVQLANEPVLVGVGL
ncbi:MAG TPA: UDP-N-acetylmuramate dehydrogenase [Streptosporangiaceae bacterium]